MILMKFIFEWAVIITAFFHRNKIRYILPSIEKSIALNITGSKVIPNFVNRKVNRYFSVFLRLFLWVSPEKVVSWFIVRHDNSNNSSLTFIVTGIWIKKYFWMVSLQRVIKKSLFLWRIKSLLVINCVGNYDVLGMVSRNAG